MGSVLWDAVNVLRKKKEWNGLVEATMNILQLIQKISVFVIKISKYQIGSNFHPKFYNNLGEIPENNVI